MLGLGRATAGLRRSSSLRLGPTHRDRRLPPILDGLLLHVPFDHDADAIWSAGGRAIEVPSAHSVDADGTYVDHRSGLITQATVDVPRIQAKGVLLEGARTNLMPRSAEIDVTPWLDQGTPVVTANAAVAPDGTTTAEEIEDNDAAAVEGRRWSITGTVAKYAYSAFLKAGSGPQGRYVELMAYSGAKVAQCFFDLTTGIAIPSAGDPSDTHGIAYLNGFYRSWIGHTLSVAVWPNYILPASCTTPGVRDLAGVGSCYAWGVQWELAPFPSSYIPAAGASVARAADDLQFDNAAAKHVKAAAGTLSCAVTPGFDGADLAGDAYIFDTSDGADGVRAFYDQSNSGKLTVEVLSGGAPVATLVGTAAVVDTTVAMSVAWAVNDFELYEDGVSVDTDAAGAAPTAIGGNIFLGQDKDGANHGFCRVAHLMAYDRRAAAGEIKVVSDWIGAQV